MRRSALLTVSLAVIFAAHSARAQQSRAFAGQADLDRALESARGAWGLFTNVEIRLEPMNSCDTRHGNEATMATTQLLTETTTTTSGVPGEAPVTVERSVMVIRFNSNCKWNNALVDEVMLHEYGHALGVGHSKNKASIMTPVIGETKVTLDGIPLSFKRKLSITDQDLAAAANYRRTRSTGISLAPSLVAGHQVTGQTTVN